MKYGIIGCGKMGTIILESLCSILKNNAKNIIVSDIEEKNLNFAKKKFNLETTLSNIELSKISDVIILAIKPQEFKTVLPEIHSYINKNKFIISIAAGVSIKFIESCLSKNIAIARCMPNLPLKYGFGLTALCYNKNVTMSQKEFVRKLFSSRGKILEISENKIDTITAISGSGPAYIFYISEVMQNICKKFGFSLKLSELIVNQTILGAAQMLSLSSIPARNLKESVTSKGGTTEQALKVFYEKNLEKIFFTAIKKAKERAEELSKMLV